MLSEAAQDVDLGRWTVTQEFLNRYLATVEDPSSIYREENLVPPIALAARILGQLIEKLTLPPGTVHISQEVLSLKAVAVGQEVQGLARTSRPFLRGEWQFLSIDFALSCQQQDVLKGKTTVMSPVKV